MAKEFLDDNKFEALLKLRTGLQHMDVVTMYRKVLTRISMVLWPGGPQTT
ncbi:hypothetical protein LO771_27850 [Streptacidiphilus sp. ASG 303]|nr:hypothetical protein [Streptacidiphilus sp. ASG 303]MCD0486092.1 hypothetical protein [Streptacidiphilus sp. ASG 303]